MDFSSRVYKEADKRRSEMTVLEMFMRFSPPAIALSLALVMVSSVSNSKKADSEINPRSVALVTEARALSAGAKYEAANDTLESALAVDPKNRAAFIALAQVAQKQALPGKAIRYYREALMLEPNDVVALSGQGEAMIQRGALARARDNLARISQICPTACAEQKTLAAAIEKGAAMPVVSAEAVQPKPVVGTLPAKP
jgi:tetratricopeptide (TPR) repeat protein